MDNAMGQRFQGLDLFLPRKSLNTMNIPNPPSSSVLEEQDLHRQPIQQFYENSLERYGMDSEQTRMFAQHLSAYQGGSELQTYDSELS
jgi:hypothetical protein